MTTPSQIVNRAGELWTVRYDASPLLTTIGGYLMMSNGLSLITVSTHLSPDEQARARTDLLQQLVEAPIDAVQTIYWSAQPPRSDGDDD